MSSKLDLVFLNIKMAYKLKERFKFICHLKNKSMSETIVYLINEYVRENSLEKDLTTDN